MQRALHAAFLAALMALVSSNAIGANDLDIAWGTNSSSADGNPSITIGPNRKLMVVLPKPVLQGAESAGFSTQATVQSFLQKYGPRLCSQILDLNAPQKDLKIELRILDRESKESRLLVVSPEHEDFVLDYIPTNRVHCVAPSENVS
ncbi:MAG: hypothetical protein JO188_17560 [Hyphomicrobiales bacterium]|nr:hypothetical protein [Hyphomicrobiales bacterium]